MTPADPVAANTATRWHTQSIFGGGDVPIEERGDCVRACITSILGLPLDAVANVHGDNWWGRLNAEVEKYGYALAILDVTMDPPPTYWVASVPSLTLGPEPDGSQALHCVVAHGNALIHDPSPVKPGYTAEKWAEVWNADEIDSGWVLVPLRDPAKVAA